MFYIGVRLLCFVPNLNRMHTVSPTSSRKTFIAKLGGLLAAVWVAPALFARSGAGSAGQPVASVTLRPEPRAVSRKAGSY